MKISLGPTSTKMQLNLVNNNLNTELGNGSNGGSIRNLSSSLSIQRKVRPNQPGKHHDLGTDAKVDSTQTMGLNAELLSLLPLHYYLRVSRNFSNQIFWKEKQTNKQQQMMFHKAAMAKRDKNADMDKQWSMA